MGGGMVPGSAPVNLPPRYPSQLEAGQPTSSMQQQSSTLNNLQMLPTTSMNQGMNPGVVSSVPGGVCAPPPSSADPEKRKLIQQQLVLLLHAHKCQRRDREQQAQGNGGEVTQCVLPHCRTMKDVLNHMTTCQASKTCSVPHCSSSRQIIAHWKHCNRQDCPVCLPLKQADPRRNPNDMLSATGPAGLQRPPVPGQQPNVGPPGGGGVPPNGTAPNLQPGGGPPSQANLEAARRALGITNDNQAQPRPQGMPNMPGIRQQTMLQQQSPGQMHNVRPGGGMPTGGMMNQQPGQRMSVPSPISRPPMSTSGGPQYDQIASTLMEPTRNILPDEIQNAVIAAPVQSTKEWHNMVTPDLRNHLVHKLVQAIFPTPNTHDMLDERLHSLVSYARKVEGDMYEAANSRNEYYHLLAEKIYKIQKELEEKRRRRQDVQGRQQQQQPQGQIRPPGVQQVHQPGMMGGPQLGNTMDNSQENNSSDLLRRQLQQPGQIRPPMSNTSLANQNNQMQGQQQLPNPQLVNDPNMVGGQSQLENLLKKSTHDIDPSELAKAHEMRTKVPSVNPLSSGGPGAAQAGAVMTQAATQQQMMTSVASNNQNNISQTNGPEPTIKMEPDSKHGISDLEVKTEFKTEVEPKQEPMDSAPNNSSSSQAVKMEVDVKPKIKEEPNTP